jgi:3-hydroxybutyryl-CoA dehydrogenase
MNLLSTLNYSDSTRARAREAFLQMSDRKELIAVIGAGTMGAGIAQIAAQAGYNVALNDTSDDLLKRGISRIEDNLAKGIARGKVTEIERHAALSRIKLTSDVGEAVSGSILVIEAITEDLAAKHELFKRIEQSAVRKAVLASNTSSLSIREIGLAIEDKSRLIGMHFFNPPHIMKLLEIIITSDTSTQAIDLAREVGARMQKESITVKDSPGFATSRLGVCVGLEAIRMVEEGVASPADIDKALVLGYNHPMGPLRLGDLVGLDVRLGVAEYLYGKLGDRFRPPELLRQMVRESKLGQKTGKGFYEW